MQLSQTMLIHRVSFTTMASKQAVRFFAASTKSGMGSIHLQCHVKPGASKQREGVASFNDEAIELCVAAAAREGEANKAVREISES